MTPVVKLSPCALSLVRKDETLTLTKMENNMKKTITLNDFRDAFIRMNRKENFSYEGLQALFEFLEDYEAEFDIELELDVIALCCEFAEYKNLEDFWNDYPKESYPDREAIESATTFIAIDDESFIIEQF